MHLQSLARLCGSFRRSSFIPTMSANTLDSVVSSTTGAQEGPLSSFLSSLSSSPYAVGSAWLISSAVFTTYSTTRFLKYSYEENSQLKEKLRTVELPFRKHMNRFFTLPPPNLLTTYRFAGSLLLGLLLHPDFAVMDRLRSTIASVPDFVWPAIFLFTANLANSIALDRIGISLTYTSKCGIPLMTVLLTALLDGVGALPNAAALASLLPIAVGIAAASWNTPTFELFGFLAALLSTTAQSALNVSSKKALTKTGLSGPVAQRCMVAIGLAITMVFNLAHFVLESRQEQEMEEKLAELRKAPPAWLTLMAVSAYHVEYVLSFVFVKLVRPITYGTCDAVRRLTIILTGRALFGGDPLTKLNIAGIALALLGALAYSIASTL